MELKAHTHRREESLPELSEDIERLVQFAYPDAAESMVEVLAKEQLVDALPGGYAPVDKAESLRNTENCIGDCTGT